MSIFSFLKKTKKFNDLIFYRDSEIYKYTNK